MPAPRRLVLPICLLVAVISGAAGILLLRDAAGAPTRTLTVDGVPLLEVLPADANVRSTPVGGVVVVHGFAGSARLMRGFAETLASHGYVVVLPDLAGHGANPARLSGQDRRIDSDVQVAVGHLVTAYGLGHDRIALVGHSMGAAAVTRYATADPDIVATVAVSLGDASDIPPSPSRPRNLLLLVGALEFPAFRAAATDALHRADPGAEFGATIGDPGEGTGRRAVAIGGAEHISVLYADQTHQETVGWIDAALARDPVAVRSHATQRLAAAGLLLMSLLVGFVPLAAWLLPRPGPAAGSAMPVGAVPGLPAFAAMVIGCLLAAVAAQSLPTTALPLAVGGHAAGFFLVVGAAMLVGWRLGPHDRRGAGSGEPAPARVAVAAVILVAYAAVAIAVPVHLGLTHALPVGARWWLLPLLVGCVAVLLLGAELAGGRRWWFSAVALGATTAGLLLAVVLRTGPAFLLLVLPLLAVLFAWHLVWAAVLVRLRAPAWLAALVGAVVVAWPIALSLPLV